MLSPTTADATGEFASTNTLVLGARPKIVKLAPLNRRPGARARFAYTGRHGDPGMPAISFTECGLRQPHAALSGGAGSRAEQTGGAITQPGKPSAARRHAAAAVREDTDSAAGALAANTRSAPLAPVEAGPQSRDRAAPENHNRAIIDHIADLVCALTQGNAANVLLEGIDPHLVETTGNTAVEEPVAALPNPAYRATMVADAGAEAGRSVLTTVHRPENTDNPECLASIMRELKHITADGMPELFPIHPRTTAAVGHSDAEKTPPGIIARKPLDYRDFLALTAESALLISDSDRVQKEATALRRPLITVGMSTERPEAPQDFASPVEPGPTIGKQARSLLTDLPGTRQRLESVIRERVRGW